MRCSMGQLYGRVRDISSEVGVHGRLTHLDESFLPLPLAQVSQFVAVLDRQGDNICLTVFYERATRESFWDDAT